MVSALTWPLVGWAVIGSLIGTLVGRLPGLSPVALVALALPAVTALGAGPALVLLGAIYCGASHAGAAHQGGLLASIGRFVAAVVAAFAVALVAPPLIALAFRFAAAEYAALLLLGLVAFAASSPGSTLKSLAMVVLGMLLAQLGVGSGINRSLDAAAASSASAASAAAASAASAVAASASAASASASSGVAHLATGGKLGLAVIGLGVFAVGAAIARLGDALTPGPSTPSTEGARPWLVPNRRELAAAAPAIARNTLFGGLLGLLPGRWTKRSDAAGSTADRRTSAAAAAMPSAATRTSFVPLLILGVPPNAALGLVLGAMTAVGVDLGPPFAASRPLLFDGLVVSLIVGALALLAVDLLPIGAWLRRRSFAALPWLAAAVVLMACLGVWSIGIAANGGMAGLDLYVLAVFAVLGYAWRKLGCDAAAMLLGFVVWPLLEENLRAALAASNGDWRVFVIRPLSFVILVASAALMVAGFFWPGRKRREANLDSA